MITVTWKATGAMAENFRTIGGLAAWLSTSDYGVTSKLNGHQSVDLRDVKIPAEEHGIALELINAGYYKNGKAVKQA